MVVDSFYENVRAHTMEHRTLAEGERERNVVLEFTPEPAQPMFIACLWSHWTDPKEPDLRGFAAIPAKTAPAPTGVIPLRPFKYDAKNQIARCPKEKVLRRYTRTHHDWFYKSATHDCDHCELRATCLSPKVRRRGLVISNGYETLLRARRRRVNWSSREFFLYGRHRWRSEGVNAEAKRWHGMRRAVRRGLKNMSIQAYLTASAINLKRLSR